ncbi:MAG: DNA-binding protein WhiA [Syntrophomonadaceae bacterium]|jgi:DNA-binding protein WhiA|nr:DNA-binding protein WhiA [Syntrophomonadaceae bacterium]
MSFAAEVRNELARIIPDKECCRKAELHAIFITSGQEFTMPNEEYLLLVKVENAATARKVFQLLKQTYHVQATVEIDNKKRFKKTRRYSISALLDAEQKKELADFKMPLNAKNIINRTWVSKNCCRKAFLRGIFLSRGFISKPESNYHLEIVLNNDELASELVKLFSKFNLHARIVQRKQQLVIYIKESEQIVDFLRIAGASKALLHFENIRILKSMRNTVNRQVNCETANLAKTIEAAVRQIELVEKLSVNEELGSLTAPLNEIAQLRISYPDATLKELGEMLTPPLSKSGVAYHMRRLEKRAREIIGHGRK